MLIEHVPIKLDVERKLKFNNRAMAVAEREIAKFWGLSRVSILKQVEKGDLSASELGILVWAGLLHEDRGLTLERVQELTAETPLQAMLGPVVEALLRYFVGQNRDLVTRHSSLATDEGPAANPPIPQSGTGSSSGPSDGMTSG
jgi:hypothetical protein